ncbi:Amidase [Ilyonectria robusta]
MGTTSGSFALQGLNASKDATMATLLRKAGCVVIGKSNMSVRQPSTGNPVSVTPEVLKGYRNGATRRDLASRADGLQSETPAGSSSGGAVAVAAGFAPISIGTEADGSIVQRAIRAALYGMKSAAWDSADVMEVLLPGRDFHSCLGRSWKGIRIALLNYEQWQFDDEECIKTPVFDQEHKRDISHAMKAIESLGGKVVYDAPLMMLDDVVKTYKTAEMGTISRHQLSFVIKRYLALFDNPQMRTLEDVVEFNKRHADVELPPEQPSQEVFENGLKDNTTDEEYHISLDYLRRSVRETMEKLWAETGTDVIMASGESNLTTTAAAAGYPIASVPLGFSTFNGRPYGLEIVARNGAEDKLFQVMSAWEATFADARRPPPLLEKWMTRI